MPIFWDLCFQSTNPYLELCELSVRIQITQPCSECMRSGDVYRALELLTALLNNNNKQHSLITIIMVLTSASKIGSASLDISLLALFHG